MTAGSPFASGPAGPPDLVDPALHATDEPHRIWRALRRHDPVHWQQVRPGLGFWSLTRFADVDAVLRAPDAFTSERGTLLSLLGSSDPAAGRQMGVTDPPCHAGMRDPLQRALTMRRVEAHGDHIRREVRALLADIPDGEPFDFAAAMAVLPMAVNGPLMGLPRADWSRLARLTMMAVAPDDPDFRLPTGAADTLRVAHRELFAYFQDLLRARRLAPGDDLVSRLMTARVDGRPMRSGAVIANCYGLILGANTTTPHVATGTLAALDRDGYRRWAADPALLASGVEEALRWTSPANHLLRHATRDVRVGATTIEAGQAVVLWLGSANRDDRAFPSPEEFRPDRRPNRHLAFGAGPHYCVGHTIARVTLRLLFDEFFRQVEAYDVVAPPERLSSTFIAGHRRLSLSVRRRANDRAPAVAG